MSGAPAPRPSSAAERKKLIDEYTQAKRTEVERLSAEEQLKRVQKKRTQVTILCVLLALTIWVSMAPPAFIKPAPAPLPTPQERESSIRFAMFIQAQQIESFRAANGRLPGTLEETGQPLNGIQYTILPGNQYALRSTADTAIRYASSDSLSRFLGESMSHMGGQQ